jgi:hypothetical protein
MMIRTGLFCYSGDIQMVTDIDLLYICCVAAVFVLSLEIQLSRVEGSVGIPLTGLNHK